MGSNRRLGPAFVAVALAGLLSTTLAMAQEPDAGTRVAARELAVAGAEAFEKQDYQTALDRFRRAESLYKVPSITVMAARCLAQLGRVVEAVDKYEETLRMPLDASAPDAFQRAVAEAATEVEQVRARVARLELRPPREEPAGLEIMLDGSPVPRALWSVPKPVDPGTHRVTAHATGHDPYSYDVALTEGSSRGVEITLLKTFVPEPVRAAPVSDVGSRVSRVGVGLLAGGGVALAVGAVTGVVALNHKSKLDDACKPGCPADLRDELASFRRNRALSYVGFGLGLAAAGAGSYFLLHEAGSGRRVEARLFPSGAAVTGSF